MKLQAWVMGACLMAPGLGLAAEAVLSVNTVDVQLLKSNPPQLSIMATGMVRSGGWHGAKLVPVVYVQPPPDGIYDFTFEATPPSGMATQALVPIAAHYLGVSPSPAIRGVRVRAETNTRTAEIGGGSLAALAAPEGLSAGLAGLADSAGSAGRDSGRVCGGIAGLTCPGQTVCIKPAGTCDVPDMMGHCATPPRVCPKIHKPVCGCDGRTYGNACEARGAGVSVRHEGQCGLRAGAVPRTNGNAGHVVPGFPRCGFSQYPKRPQGQCNGPAVCTDRPMVCTEEYRPVCGCDFRTYGNACEAARAGRNVMAGGTCESFFENARLRLRERLLRMPPTWPPVEPGPWGVRPGWR